MIPAILSAVFVFYLYNTLNSADSPKDTTEADSSTEDLSSRLRGLQIRIERVAEELSQKGGQQ